MDLPIADGRTDYVRIAEAIAYLRAHQRRQPDLAAHLEHSPVETAALLGRIFHSKEAGGEKSLSVWVSGSNFQIQVWRALLQIPFARLLNWQRFSVDRRPPVQWVMPLRTIRWPTSSPVIVCCGRAVISVSITGGLSVRPPWLSGRRQAMQKRCADHNGLIDNRAGGRRSYTRVMVQIVLPSAPGLP